MNGFCNIDEKRIKLYFAAHIVRSCQKYYALDVRSLEFCFPESLSVSRDEVEANMESRGKTKLAISRERRHELFAKTFIKIFIQHLYFITKFKNFSGWSNFKTERTLPKLVQQFVQPYSHLFHSTCTTFESRSF